jgi:hypothetical protein
MRRLAFGLLAAPCLFGTAHGQLPGGPVIAGPPPVPPITQAPFVPPAPAQPRSNVPATPSLRTFDCLTTEIKYADNRWVLFADGAVLKEFGPREADARAALAIIRTLKLNQHGTIGTPPVMEYWLTDGHAPFTAETNPLKLALLDLNTLRVEEFDGQWQLRDARRQLFAFGRNRADAFLALDLIRHYGFTQIGHVGQFIPSMVYFLGSASDQGRAPSMPPPRPNGSEPGQRAYAKAGPGNLAASLSPPEKANSLTEHYRFDYRQAEVRRDKNEWQLVCGNHVLANFGTNQMDARLAWNTLQYYRFSEQCLIGRPSPSFSYFLVGGQPPRGLKFGIPVQPFQPETVLVRALGQAWAVSAGEQPLVVFERLQDARELAEAIQRLHFDHLCRIGNTPGYGMVFFARTK